MSSHVQRNISAAQKDDPEQKPQNLALASNWSKEDIEELTLSTKLCEVCQVMVGPRHLWKLRSGDEGEPVEETMEPGVASWGQHHTSYESLQHSLSIGCHVCITIHKSWSKNGSTVLDGFKGSEFYFVENASHPGRPASHFGLYTQPKDDRSVATRVYITVTGCEHSPCSCILSLVVANTSL